MREDNMIILKRYWKDCLETILEFLQRFIVLLLVNFKIVIFKVFEEEKDNIENFSKERKMICKK